MKSNYNDIVDVILTIINDEDLAKSIAVSGSIVPYLITSKESEEYHSDFYILVKEKNLNAVRKKMKVLSREYEFDFTEDSYKKTNNDCGFKMRYENTVIGFFPYSLIDNILTIRSFSIDDGDNVIIEKTRIIRNVSKSFVIRLINLNGDKKLRIMSPEFILADKESREKEPGNPTYETMILLDKISDERVLKSIRRSILDSEVIIQKHKNKKRFF